MPRSSLLALVPVVLLCTASDCPGPNPPVTPFECELGLVLEDSDFSPIAADGTTSAEMIFGFQGFLWVDVAIRGDEDSPSVADVAARIDIDGFEPLGRSIPAIVFDEAGDGTLSETVQVRLDNSEGPALYIGRPATFTLKVTGEFKETTCAATVLLVDDDPCIYTDDEPICGDDDDSAEQ
ncbi:MAG: hypothetical protein GY898_25350 [Proteobacteria bacterium]|nr:hypothetical protein [Pseudomonadota bacterium]